MRTIAPTVVSMKESAGRHARTRRSDRTVAMRETAPAGNVSVIVAELTSVRCRWCNDDLEHCHETLVRHTVGDTHCLDATCAVPDEAHHMVASCNDFGCSCAMVVFTMNSLTGAAETA
jgi:hypothetical protein